MRIKVFTPKNILDKKEFPIVISVTKEIPNEILCRLFNNNYATYHVMEILNQRDLYERLVKYEINAGEENQGIITKTNVTFIQLGYLLFEDRIKEEHAIPLFLELFKVKKDFISKIQSLKKIFTLPQLA